MRCYDVESVLARLTGSVPNLVWLRGSVIPAAGLRSCHVHQTWETQDSQYKALRRTKSCFFLILSFLFPSSTIWHTKQTQHMQTKSTHFNFILHKHVFSCTNRVNTGIIHAAPLSAISMTAQKYRKLHSTSDFITFGSSTLSHLDTGTNMPAHIPRYMVTWQHITLPCTLLLHLAQQYDNTLHNAHT